MLKHTPTCGGKLGRWIDDLTYLPCPCEMADNVAHTLGQEIASARTIKASPLLTLGERGEDPIVDLTRENVFLKGWWHDLLPHLKYAFVIRYLQGNCRFRVKIITDERLKSIWLGNEAFRSKSKSVREEDENFNSLEDAIGADFDLVLVRLGYLGYPNKAMPGILKETLMLREVARKPTWVVESPSSIFGHGHFSYDADVGDYIDRNFKVIGITGSETRQIEPHGFAGTEDVPDGEISDISIDEVMEVKRPVVQPRPRFQIQEEYVSRPKSKFKSGYGKKKGGGPI